MLHTVKLCTHRLSEPSQESWAVLAVLITPVWLTPTEKLKNLIAAYDELQVRHSQVIWKSTHALLVSPSMRYAYYSLQDICVQRKWRRSRAGAAWKRVLPMVLKGMIDGCCDLDILIDPYILHLHGTRRDFIGTSDLIECWSRSLTIASPWLQYITKTLGISSIDCQLVGKQDIRFRAWT